MHMPISKCHEVSNLFDILSLNEVNSDTCSYFDDHPSRYIVPSDTVFAGLCTGLLAATAVSASRSLVDLVPIALKTVQVAFRIGGKVFQATQRLSTSRDGNVARSWSTLVIGVQKEAAASELERFNKSKVIRLSKQCIRRLTESLEPSKS